jgi:S1-C subfamily serine protease
METKTTESGSVSVALSNAMASAVERGGQAVVAVNGRPRTPSSGIIWRQGVIVTADHTVKRDEDITATLSDGRTTPATLAGRDPSTDIAVLRVEAAEVAAAETGDTSDLKVGQLVLAVGRGEGAESRCVAGLGIISALGGSWRTWRGGRVDQLVRPDISIFLGFSGGPLLDARGRVVGMNTTGLWRGLGLTIPASTVDRVAKELLDKGRIARGYLGLGMQRVELPDSLRSKLKLTSDSGMIVMSVEPGGPAEKAGGLVGDILTALDGKPVNEFRDVQAFLAAEKTGKTVSASLLRGGAPLELKITLGERSLRDE